MNAHPENLRQRSLDSSPLALLSPDSHRSFEDVWSTPETLGSQINLRPGSFDGSEWAQITAKFRNENFLQCWEYAHAKASSESWEVERAVLVENGEIVGAVQALIKPISFLKRGLVWINRGPLWRHNEGWDASLLLRILGEIRRYWVNERQMYLRIALPILEQDVDMGALRHLGYEETGAPGWSSALVDLSLSEEALRSRLRERWRTYINKAAREGVSVETSHDESALNQALSLYSDMLNQRQYETSVTVPLLSILQKELPSERKLLVFTARMNQDLLGAVIVGRSGETGDYLVGSLTEKGRSKKYIGFYLLWQAICEMRRQGYRWFDLGGMTPEPVRRDISHFKLGFNAIPYRLVGELQSSSGGLVNRLIQWRVAKARKQD